MVRGTVAVADVELACVSDGARQVLLGAAAGLGHVDRLRQEGRDGGRKRAAVKGTETTLLKSRS